jgi:hypothetical protein
MTQGAPKNPRTTVKKAIEPEPGDEQFDLDEWLAKRGLTGRRVMKLGGEWFEFDRAAVSEQLVSYEKQRAEKGMMAALGEFLVDPSRKADLGKAIERQKQPIAAELQHEFLVSIADFIIHGDAEYTAKAEQDSKKAATGESSAS